MATQRWRAEESYAVLSQMAQSSLWGDTANSHPRATRGLLCPGTTLSSPWWGSDELTSPNIPARRQV